MQEHLSFTAEESNVKVVWVIVNTVSASSQRDELCNLAKVACLCSVTCFISRLSLSMTLSHH